jgi:hypothetical protein
MRNPLTNWKRTLRGIYRSATMRFNLILLLLAQHDAEIIGFIAANQPDLLALLPSNLHKAMGVMVVIGNLYLRARTTTSLTERGTKEPQ